MRLGSLLGGAAWLLRGLPSVRRSSGVSRSLEPDSGLARTEGCLRHAVLRETGEEPFEGPLSNFIVDRRCTLFLQDCVAVNPQDVVDTADAETLPEEGKFRLWVLAKLDAFVHGSDDVCLAQELVRDELPRPDSNSECGAAGCGGFGQAPNVANFPLRRCCVQVGHEVEDFRFSVSSAQRRLWHWQRRSPEEKVAPGLGDT